MKKQCLRPDNMKLQIRLTPEERAHLDSQAEAAGMTRSALIRSLISSCVLRTAVDQRVLSELSRLGGLVKKAWSEGAPPEATRSALNALEHAARRIVVNI